MTEYALIVAVVAMVAYSASGTNISTLVSNVSGKL